jgi:hypothetical protein
MFKFQLGTEVRVQPEEGKVFDGTITGRAEYQASENAYLISPSGVKNPEKSKKHDWYDESRIQGLTKRFK